MTQGDSVGPTTGESDRRLMVRVLLSTVAFGLCACAVCSGWQSMFDWFANNANTERDAAYAAAHWRLLPTPPEPLTRLVAAGIGVVVAETQGGVWLSCSRNSRFDIDCWNEVTSLPDVPKDSCNWRFNYEYPAVEFEAVDQVSAELCYYGFAGNHPEMSRYTYVLTAQGEVWQWGFDEILLAPTPNLDRLYWRSNFVALMLLGWVPLGGVALLWVEPVVRELKRIVRKRSV